MEERQYELVNNILREIYGRRRRRRKKQKENDDDDVVVVDMTEKYNKYTEYFYFEIKLLEMFPTTNLLVYYNKKFPNLSPQEIFIGYLKGDGIMTKYRELLLYEMNNNKVDLFQMVTPNLSKELWYVEKDLKLNGLLTVYCRMNLTDMKNMLKTCPEPTICLSRATYKITDPEMFVNVVNALDDKVKKCLNFIPFLRNYSKHHSIKPEGVYYTYDKIKLLDKNYFNFINKK